MYNRGEIMSEIERQTIYNWVINTLWSKLETITFNRLHYFLNRNDSSILPLIWEIKERIVNKESMGGFQQEPTLKDFLAVIPKTAYIQKHTDRNIRELVHIRFNVFISSPGNSSVGNSFFSAYDFWLKTSVSMGMWAEFTNQERPQDDCIYLNSTQKNNCLIFKLTLMMIWLIGQTLLFFHSPHNLWLRKFIPESGK
jgi:hypothetical protein